MRSLVVSCFIFLAACTSPKGLDPSRLPAMDAIPLEREIQTDFNSDKVEDSVKIIPPSEISDYHTLEIHLSSKNDFQKIENKKLIYAFSNPGASLEVLENGSFKVIIDHSSIGRSASLREYTISYRDEKFILSGITISEYDRIDPDLGGSCDINLLTGQGERNAKPIKVKRERIELSSLGFEWLPKVCRF